MIIEDQPWIVNARTWIGCKSVTDYCVELGRPWTGHVPSLAPGHVLAVCPSVRSQAGLVPVRVSTIILDTCIRPCAHQFRSRLSSVPIRLGHGAVHCALSMRQGVYLPHELVPRSCGPALCSTHCLCDLVLCPCTQLCARAAGPAPI